MTVDKRSRSSRAKRRGSGRRHRTWRRRLLLAGAAVLGLVGVLLGFSLALQPQKAGLAQSLEEALAFSAQGELTEAIARLKVGLQQEPDNAKMRWLLSEMYIKQGHGAAALKELERLQELGAGELVVTPRVIRALLLEQRFQDALARLAFSQPLPGDPTVHLQRGEARLGLGRLAMARAAFDEAMGVDAPKRGGALRGLAAVALAENDGTEAQQRIAAAIEVEPDNAKAWELKGTIEIQHGRLAAAQAAFERALVLSPLNLAAKSGLIEALLDQQKTDTASRHLAELLALHKKMPWTNAATYHFLDARRSLAGAMDLSAAYLALLQALKLYPEHPPSLLLAGWVNLQQGQTHSAQTYLEKYNRRNPDCAKGARALADLYLKTGRASDAIDVLSRAVERPTWNEELVAKLVEAYEQAGDVARAMEVLRRAVVMASDSASMRTRLAARLIDSGEVAQGLRELANVLAAHPDDPQAELLQARAFFEQGNHASALARTAMLAQKRPEDPKPLLLTARVLERRGSVHGAREAYERALKRDPSSSVAMYNLARLSWEAGEHQLAGERFGAVLQVKPGHLPSLEALARLALDAGQPGKALAYYEQARDANPSAPGPHLQLVSLYTRLGRSLDALAAAQRAAVALPDDPKVMWVLGRAQLAASESKAALVTLDALVARDTDVAAVHLDHARARLHTDDTAGARASLQQALALAPDDVVPVLLVGAEVDIRLGRFDAALATAKRIQKNHPALAAGYRLEGDVLLARQQPAVAAAAYRVALERERTWATISKLQAVYRSTGETERADSLVRGWLREHPQHVAARVALAQDLRKLGKPKLAALELEQALQYMPDNVLILVQLAQLNGEAGNPQALDYAERAYELSPDDPRALATYGWLMARSRGPKRGRGLTLLEAAVKKTPDDPEIRYQLASTLALHGDRRRARKELEALLNMNQAVVDPRELRRVMDDLQY